jgi:hypothetical protein
VTFDEMYPHAEHLDMVEGCILKGGSPRPCWHCNRSTWFLEINFEAALCSPDCVKAKDEEYWKAVAS